MMFQNENYSIVQERCHATRILFNIPEVGIFKSQQSTFQKFGDYAVNDYDNYALFTIIYYFVQRIQASLTSFLKRFSIGYFGKVRPFSQFINLFALCFYILNGHALPFPKIKIS